MHLSVIVPTNPFDCWRSDFGPKSSKETRRISSLGRTNLAIAMISWIVVKLWKADIIHIINCWLRLVWILNGFLAVLCLLSSHVLMPLYSFFSIRMEWWSRRMFLPPVLIQWSTRLVDLLLSITIESYPDWEMRTVVDEPKRVLVGTAGVFAALKRGWSSLVTPYRVDDSFSM